MITKLLQRWKLWRAESDAIYFDLHGHKRLADKHWAIAADIRRTLAR